MSTPNPETPQCGEPRKKIAILGGGLGSLVTALELTRPGVNLGKYEITIYQMGWRLGGKGASGRNAMDDERIEEHGLHVWFGFYENAFRLIREVMAEWKIPADHPWATDDPAERWTRAFKPHSYAPLAEMRGGRWNLWNFRFGPAEGTPGDGSNPLDNIWDILHHLARRLLDVAGRSHEWHEAGAGAASPRAVENHATSAGEIIVWLEKRAVKTVGSLWKSAVALVRRGIAWMRLVLLGRTISAVVIEGWLTSPNESVRRLGILLNLGWALFRGLVWNAFSIARNTLDVLDGTDLRDFLCRHGATREAVNSPLAVAIYCGAFAYEGGDPAKLRMAAGAGIRSLLRIMLSYKGAMSWKMQAGMGDTIFMPIYEVLKARGVRFEFFHVVRGLRLSPDRKRIAEVVLGRQVTLVNPGGGYDPRRSVKGFDCWPSDPLWNQIAPAEVQQLQQAGIDLEDPDAKWPDRETVTLRAAAAPADGGFDRVVLGISIAALPAIAGELIAANHRFRKMIERVRTVRTGAFQLWQKQDLAALGWTQDSPVLGTYLDPLNTWADMSHLLDREGHPPERGIRNLSYFCGPVPDSVPDGQGAEYVGKKSDELLAELGRSLWPKFEPKLEVARYVRCNTKANERYVLTLPRSTKCRLAADESGFENLVLAGDWTRNQFNVGCVEATVMSGMFASLAISGSPARNRIVYSAGP